MTVSLSRYLAPYDIQIGAITDGVANSVYPPWQAIQRALFKRPRILIRRWRTHGSFWDGVNRANKVSYRPYLGHNAGHPTAVAIASAFPKEWREYFKFTVIRNPWDKLVSDYYYRIASVEDPPPFDAFVRAVVSGDALNGIVEEPRRNWEIYTINDHLAVDRVVRYESLEDGLNEVIGEIGIKWDGWLPHAKEAHRKRRRGARYQDMYDPTTRKLVEQFHEGEIELGKYSFQ